MRLARPHLSSSSTGGSTGGRLLMASPTGGSAPACDSRMSQLASVKHSVTLTGVPGAQ